MSNGLSEWIPTHVHQAVSLLFLSILFSLSPLVSCQWIDDHVVCTSSRSGNLGGLGARLGLAEAEVLTTLYVNFDYKDFLLLKQHP